VVCVAWVDAETISMRKKGRTKAESPEKMPVETTGIQMSRPAAPAGPSREQLTGGNQPADESDVARLVMQFIARK
jgi:hypothetical protein